MTKKSKKIILWVVGVWFASSLFFGGLALLIESTSDNHTTEQTDTKAVNTKVLKQADGSILVDSLYHLYLSNNYTLSFYPSKIRFAHLRLHFTDNVAVYTIYPNKELSSNGLYYLGFKFYNDEWPCAAFTFSDDEKNDTLYAYPQSGYPSRKTFKKEKFNRLQYAIEHNYKTQIKPIEYDDLVSYIDMIVLDVNKKRYEIKPGNEAFYVLMNGIFHQKVYNLE